MGQRHQIYLIGKTTDDKGKTKFRTMLAYHHQWLYGSRASQKVLEACKMFEAFEYPRFDERNLEAVMYSVYGLDQNKNGTISSSILHDEREYLIDEKTGKALITRGDNNDGVTLIVLEMLKDSDSYSSSKFEASYCLASFQGVEGSHSESMKDFKPYNAYEYLSFYYNKEEQEACLEDKSDICDAIKYIWLNQNSYKPVKQTDFNKIIKKD